MYIWTSRVSPLHTDVHNDEVDTYFLFCSQWYYFLCVKASNVSVVRQWRDLLEYRRTGTYDLNMMYIALLKSHEMILNYKTGT